MIVILQGSKNPSQRKQPGKNWGENLHPALNYAARYSQESRGQLILLASVFTQWARRALPSELSAGERKEREFFSQLPFTAHFPWANMQTTGSSFTDVSRMDPMALQHLLKQLNPDPTGRCFTNTQSTEGPVWGPQTKRCSRLWGHMGLFLRHSQDVYFRV